MAINWLEQVKKDAEEITQRRLDDDANKLGIDFHQEREDAINKAELESDSISSGTEEAKSTDVNPQAPTPKSVAVDSKKSKK